MICVECGSDVRALYREYSKGNIRLAHCPHCSSIADKYVELEGHIVFIDLILHRVQAYRHVLFNRQIVRISKEVVKFLVVIFAFDSFDRWFLLHHKPNFDRPWEEFTRWLRPHENQWLIPLSSIGETVIYMASICAITEVIVRINNKAGEKRRSIDFRFLVSSVILSCFSKLGILLWMVWDAQLLHRRTISFLTLTSNYLAVKVFMRSSGWREPLIVVLGAFLVRTLLSLWLSYMVPGLVFKFL